MSVGRTAAGGRSRASMRLARVFNLLPSAFPNPAVLSLSRLRAAQVQAHLQRGGGAGARRRFPRQSGIDCARQPSGNQQRVATASRRHALRRSHTGRVRRAPAFRGRRRVAARAHARLAGHAPLAGRGAAIVRGLAGEPADKRRRRKRAHAAHAQLIHSRACASITAARSAEARARRAGRRAERRPR